MIRHQVALIVALALLAAMASMTVLVPDLFAAPALTQNAPTSSATTPDSVAEQVLKHATLIVRARVVEVTSGWSEERSHIQSQSRLKIHYVLRGAIDDTSIIRTIGGYLPAENLSMMASEEPTLSQGEEVILFLARRLATYEIVAGHDGKYIVHDGQVQHSGLLFAESLGTFYARLGQFDANITLSQEWAAQEATISQASIVSPSDYVYKGMRWDTNTVEFKVNLNSTQIEGGNGTASDFLKALQSAANTWTMVEEADFLLVYAGRTDAVSSGYNRSNDVFFEDRGQFDENGVRRPLAVATVWYSNGIILDADIWINDAYVWDATGSPDWSEIDLESVVLHEFGHWLSLGHDPDSRAVMYYAIMSGSLRRTLFENDRNGISFIYPCGRDGGCAPEPIATSTPTTTPSPAPTPTFTATPTATPASAPTAAPVTAIVTNEEGGTLEFSSAPGSQIILNVPPRAVFTDTVLSIKPVALAPPVPTSYCPLIGYFQIVAGPAGMDHDIFIFQTPATLTIYYSATTADNLPADRICLLAVNDVSDGWEGLTCTYQEIDADVRSMTASIDHPSTFGLFRIDTRLYLPAVTR